MCAYVVGQIEKLDGDTAVVATAAGPVIAGRRLRATARPGDWVLMYCGQIVEVVTAEEAREVVALAQELAAGPGFG